MSKSTSQSNNFAPKDFVLAITYQCNSRCQFCNIWQKKGTASCQPIDYTNLPRNAQNINLSGGEPFLKKELPEIIRIISRQCPKAKIVISTNGFSPSLIKKQMQKIIRFKRDIGIAVSLDGFGRVHEELRGFPGGYSLVLETIRLLKELGLRDIKIAFTLGDQNINQLKRIYRLSRELEVEFSLAAYHNSNHYFDKNDNQINNLKKINRELNWLIDQEIKSFSPKKWLRAYFAWGLLRFLEEQKRILPDYSGLTSLFIDPIGNIYPSDVWGLRIGRLRRVRNWSDFGLRTREMLLPQKSPINWMICTTRQAIRKHWLRVGFWIIKAKIKLLFPAQRIDCQSNRSKVVVSTN